MSRKRFSVEQIINHLREAEVLLAQGQTVGEICRRIGVSEQRYYRWRREYTGITDWFRTMAFKKAQPAAQVTDSPENLFLDLPRRKIPDVLPHQREVMRT
jgi:transposase-like protein